MAELEAYIGQDSADNTCLDETVVVLTDFSRGLIHGAVESPCNGALQLASCTIAPLSGLQFPKLEITGLEKSMEAGDCNALAVESGAAIGQIAPLYLTNKVTGKLLGKTISNTKVDDFLGTRSLLSTLPTATKHGLVTGGLVGFALTPVPEDQNNLVGHALSGANCAATFTVFNIASEAGRSRLRMYGQLSSLTTQDFLTKQLPLTAAVGVGAGASAGAVNAQINSLFREGRLARGEETARQMFTDGIMGGAFGALHEGQSRLTRAAQLTRQQNESLKVKRFDVDDPKFKKLLEEAIPLEERESIDSIKETITRDPHPYAYRAEVNYPNGERIPQEVRFAKMQDRWQSGEPLVSGFLQSISGPNGEPVGFALVENYAARQYIAGEKPFSMLAYFGVHPQLRSAGLGTEYFNNRLIPSLNKDFPRHVGLAVEIEAFQGLPSNSQQQQRVGFYLKKGKMDQLDVKYPLTPFSEKPTEAGYEPVAEREFKPIDAALLWRSLDGKPVDGDVAHSVMTRLFHSGYGVRCNQDIPGAYTDPYAAGFLAQIQRNTQDLRVPIVPAPGPAEKGGVGRSSLSTAEVLKRLDGHGFAAATQPALQEAVDNRNKHRTAQD